MRELAGEECIHNAIQTHASPVEGSRHTPTSPCYYLQRKCRSIADRYVEYESVLLFIDMMLHKTSVYRHLLVNRTPHSEYRQTGGGLPVRC
jgi:hypothetical protein